MGLPASTNTGGRTSAQSANHWLWAYDNLNVHSHARRERQGLLVVHTPTKFNAHLAQKHTLDHHSQMLNVTSRLAISIRNIPTDVNWDDQSPQASRSQLPVADILPDAHDASVLMERAQVFLQHFITSNLDDLHDLQSLAPSSNTAEAVEMTEVVPIKVLFRDEKYVAEMLVYWGIL